MARRMIQFSTVIGNVCPVVVVSTTVVTAVHIQNLGGMVSDTFVAGEGCKCAHDALHRQYRQRKH